MNLNQIGEKDERWAQTQQTNQPTKWNNQPKPKQTFISISNGCAINHTLFTRLAIINFSFNFFVIGIRLFLSVLVCVRLLPLTQTQMNHIRFYWRPFSIEEKIPPEWLVRMHWIVFHNSSVNSYLIVIGYCVQVWHNFMLFSCWKKKNCRLCRVLVCVSQVGKTCKLSHCVRVVCVSYSVSNFVRNVNK